jgi:hypothetical protein
MMNIRMSPRVAAITLIMTAATMPSCSSSTNNSCSPQHPCDADQYCEYSDALCGTGVKTGICLFRDPVGACEVNLDDAEVCGCDGQFYRADGCSSRRGMIADSSGTDVAADGRCGKLEGDLSCGAVVASVEQYYCVHMAGTTQYYIIQLPPQCDNHIDCQCLVGEACTAPVTPHGMTPTGETCTVDSSGGLQATCM